MISHLQGRRARRNATKPSALTDRISIGPVNGFEGLATLGALPVATWRYRWESADVRHLGPMVQDWHAAFRPGKSDTTVPMVDAHGVLVVAIQALHRQWVSCAPKLTSFTSSWPIAQHATNPSVRPAVHP